MRRSSAILSALATFAALAAAGCSPRRAAESLLLGSHFVRTEGVAYGPEARHRLDVYRPKAVRAPAPVVVFLHGGRWNSGTRGDYRLLGDALTRRGWVAVVPDYRLAPAVRFPAWVEDGARAVRWARDNAARFGGDSTRIFVVGHSAGGHSAALLALDEHYLRDSGVPAGAVRGFVSLAGPVDTTWTDPDVQALMGRREGWPATYPATHVDGTEPPLLLLHGGGDRTVAVENSVRLAARIRDRGGCARSIVYPGVGHVQIVVALSAPRLRIAPVLDDVDAFVRDPRRGCTAPS
ncbi:MAG TPA: alpha/beta hydrolase [Longimicrobium sp.]|jgi:acetyl esterase/lipase